MALHPQADDFPRWYQDVVAQAEMAENGPARGSMVIRPHGYAIWEWCQRLLDDRIKAEGVENAYFPLLIPMSFFEKEAEHVEGFAPELAVVTHGGGEQLAEPLAVRPTSETVILHLFSKWIQSYRDLPYRVNQWGNVVRWELRTRLFLRSAEFLWQEGHTAHADEEDGMRSTLLFLEVYRKFMEEDLALDAVPGEKTERERFAGAQRTFSNESLMRDGKALQSCTSHYFGENFSHPFGIMYQAEDGSQKHVTTSSWGLSTRIVGAIIMSHGDDFGLRLPPRVAPQQVVILPIAEGEPVERAHAIAAELRASGRRVRVDDRLHVSFGRRAVDWELKGAPVRIEIGPRDLAKGQAVIARRDARTKESVPLDGIGARAHDLLDEIQGTLLREHRTFRETHTSRPASLDEFRERIDGGGFFEVAWCGDGTCEDALATGTGASVRCLPFDTPPPSSTCLVCGRASDRTALVARAY